MKKRYLFLLFIILSTKMSSRAQTKQLDEYSLSVLKEKLAVAQSDTDKIRFQVALGQVMLSANGSSEKVLDSALLLAKSAAVSSSRINYKDGIVNSMLLSSTIFYGKNRADTAFSIAQRALAYAQKVNNRLGVADAYMLIGQNYSFNTLKTLYERMAYYDKAIVIFREKRSMKRLQAALTEKADLLYLAVRDTEAVKLLSEALNINKAIGFKGVQMIYWEIGRISNDIGDYPSAIKYNLLAIKVARQVGDTTLRLCSIYNTMAETYLFLRDDRRALSYSLMALKIARASKNADYIGTVLFVLAIEYTHLNQLPKALAVLNENLKYNRNAGVTKSENVLARLIAIGGFVRNLTFAGQLNEAKVYVKQMKGLLAKIRPEDYSGLTSCYRELSEYYLKSGQVKEASYYINKYAEFCHKTHFLQGIKVTEKQYFQLDSIKGNFKSAMKHYLLAQKINDAMDNATKAYQISLLHIENETEEKNNHIDALTRQALIKDGQLTHSRLIQKIVIGVTFLLLIITGLIYSRYRLKKRSNALLVRQKSEIDQQNIELQELVEDKNELLHDKDLLFKEVNHRVKNNLQIVMSLLVAPTFDFPNKVAQDVIAESQSRVQSIALIHDQLYKTDKIAEIELASYIPELLRSLEDSINKRKSFISIRHDVANIMLDVSQAIPLGIILNELVTNALKYAFPGESTGTIMVSVKQVECDIIMQIRDNGVGFNPDLNSSGSSSLGMTLIKGLTRQLKGKFTAENIDGATITITFPIVMTALERATADAMKHPA